MKFPMAPASLNQMEASRPPAVVRPAEVKNCAWYEAKLKEEAYRHTQEYAGILKDFKESGSWKEKYKTWAAACEHAMDISKTYANKLIRELESGQLPTVGQVESNRTHKKEEAALKQIESAREEEPQEEPEKPRVKSADEVKADNAQKNGHTEKPKTHAKPTDNGKPKNQLAIWRHFEESLLGPALRETDNLNRVCPNSVLHSQLLDGIKACMRLLAKWRASVK